MIGKENRQLLKSQSLRFSVCLQPFGYERERERCLCCNESDPCVVCNASLGVGDE